MWLVCHHSSGNATPVEVIRESSSSSESTPSVVPVKEESRPAHIAHHARGSLAPNPLNNRLVGMMVAVVVRTGPAVRHRLS